MDAKVGDWVVTPRQGGRSSSTRSGTTPCASPRTLAERFGRAATARASWSALARQVKERVQPAVLERRPGCCYDVVERPRRTDAADPPEPAPRDQPAVPGALTPTATRRCSSGSCAELLTPFGVRTLSPHDPAYDGRYAGNVIARDRAYHNGSAFPWLLGPLVTAYLRVHGRGEAARARGAAMLATVPRPPPRRRPRPALRAVRRRRPPRPRRRARLGAAVGEVLRCYVEDVLDRARAAPCAADRARIRPRRAGPRRIAERPLNR